MILAASADRRDARIRPRTTLITLGADDPSPVLAFHRDGLGAKTRLEMMVL
jgi:hypothetical protein